MSIDYKNQDYSPYPLSEKLKGVPKEILNAKKEIDAIINSSNQELASHTFSHYYCLEDGQKEENFSQDLNLMSRTFDHTFSSIVFPRNQINEVYLKKCAEQGYKCFRGNQVNKDWSNARFKDETKLKRARRFADSYYPVSETKSFKIEELPIQGGLINIPASRFLRPHSGKQKLEKMKMNRIKNEMTEAAKNGTIYHLWWHPHNFTSRTDKHFEQLNEIIQHFKSLEKEFGFTSLNMGEIAEHAKR